MDKPRVSVIVPAYRENERIVPVLSRIAESISIPYECLVVIDEMDDPTIDFVKNFSTQNPKFKFVHNVLGRGPANAIKQGFSSATATTAVVTMADGSDDPLLIESLVRLVERGVVVAAASRYMSGGQQVGAPKLKSLMSRSAGKTLKWFAGVGTHDATNSYKAYNVEFVRAVGIQSEHGFELGLELTAKAKRMGMPIAELPTIWLERSTGESQFQIKKWLPHYLAWYVFAYGRSHTLQELNESSNKLMLHKSKLTKKK